MRPSLQSSLRTRFGASLLSLAAAAGLTGPTAAAPAAGAGAQRPNIVLITSDDLHWDTSGLIDDDDRDVMPHLRALAERSVTYTNGFVQATVCTPSRHAMLSGRYPHRTDTEGFVSISPKLETLPSVLHDAGYRTAIINKGVNHYPWDFQVDRLDTNYGRDASVYRKLVGEQLAEAEKKKQPLFLMANTMDPHRPFAGSLQELTYGDFPPFRDKVPAPSRRWEASGVKVPPFLPDLAEVREELAEYTSSSRRSDDVIGAVLEAIEASGAADHTAIVFLSDHGMSMPFAKGNAYWFSARTAFLFSGFGVAEEQQGETLDATVQAVDLMPTLLGLTGLKVPAGLDGRPMPGVYGTPEGQGAREYAFVQFYQGTEVRRNPIYAVHGERFSYLFNPWADGRTEFGASDYGDSPSFEAMRDSPDPAVQVRYRFFRTRAVEELYDNQADPGNLHNLIDDPASAGELERLRSVLAGWMKDTDCPAQAAFAQRDNAAVLAQFMDEQLRDSLNRNAPTDRIAVKYDSTEWDAPRVAWTVQRPEGLWIVEPADGKYDKVEAEGEGAMGGGVRARERKDPWRFLYFHVHDAFARPAPVEGGSKDLGTDLTAEVTFRGAGEGAPELQYNAVGNRYRMAKLTSVDADAQGGGSVAHYTLPGARFDNSQNGGADFRLRHPADASFLVQGVTVSR